MRAKYSPLNPYKKFDKQIKNGGTLLVRNSVFIVRKGELQIAVAKESGYAEAAAPPIETLAEPKKAEKKADEPKAAATKKATTTRKKTTKAKS